MTPEPIPVGSSLQRLPLVTLYLTERCNSRCVTCDYWRHGRVDMSLDSVTQLLPSLRRLDTQWVLISGGEPLLNPQWREIAELLRQSGLSLWLLTSGLSLAKHARAAADLFEAITVSLDGTNPRTYAKIRGLDAFDKVCEGVRAAVAAQARVNLRVTLQRSNFTELPEFVDLARSLGVHQVSFLAVDVGNPHAFARTDDFTRDLALTAEDLPVLEQLIGRIEEEHGEAFRSRFIAEDPGKLRRIVRYFAGILGLGAFPEVRCNAPEFSAVIDAEGRIQPCFFIPGPPRQSRAQPLEGVLNGAAMAGLREDIRQQRRSECARCVCSMWRDPATFDAAEFPQVIRQPRAGAVPA